jgi:hypothetical protein
VAAVSYSWHLVNGEDVRYQNTEFRTQMVLSEI